MSKTNSACPFCGGKVDPTGWFNGAGKRGPECEGCGATAPSLEVWNRAGEPAAWLYKGTIDGDHLRRSRMDHFFVPIGGDGREYVKGIPLYAHADPAEVERLRVLVRGSRASLDSCALQIESLQAQLAEAQALLRTVMRHGTYAIRVGDGKSVGDQIKDYLSASTEPSAPVEIDERASFEKAVIDKAERFHPNLEQYGEHQEAEYRDPKIEWAWGLWQARAALARK